MQRLAEYRPAPRFHELWRGAGRRRSDVPDELKAALLDPSAIDDAARRRCRAPAPRPTSTPARTRRSRRTSIDGGRDEDERDPRHRRRSTSTSARCPARAPTRSPPTCGPRSATWPTRSRSRSSSNDPASISRTDTPLWDALQRAVDVPFPGATLIPQFTVGFTDARVFRELGAISYGAGLFSPTVDAGRVRPPLPRPRRARRRRVARPHRRAVAARDRRPDGLNRPSSRFCPARTGPIGPVPKDRTAVSGCGAGRGRAGRCRPGSSPG